MNNNTQIKFLKTISIQFICAQIIPDNDLTNKLEDIIYVGISICCIFLNIFKNEDATQKKRKFFW